MTVARPFLLHNTIQQYEWGTRNYDAFLPPFTGVAAEPGVPYAELWIGAHPKAPSKVLADGQAIPLTSFVAGHAPEVLGPSAAEKFSSQLPFLLKVLSAADPLSIQAHPDKAQARVLHARDPKNYPDDNHKPEIAVALDELRALAGFKPFDDILESVQRYPQLAEAAGAEAASALAAAGRYLPSRKGLGDEDVRAVQRAALKTFYRSLMTQTIGDAALLARTVSGISAQMRIELPTEERTLFLQTERLYPGDVGLLSILLLNHVRLQAGEGIFIGAGIPHAYLKGTIVECMANSDNVVRAGLTPKFKDVETLCDILTYECGEPKILAPDDGAVVMEYAAPVPEFALSRRRMKTSDRMNRTGRTGVEIMLVTEGGVTMTWGTGRETFKRGDAVLVPSALAAYEIRAESYTELFSVSIP